MDIEKEEQAQVEEELENLIADYEAQQSAEYPLWMYGL